mmetsp:Transcript_36956/g.102680  ORF Transcript_36956/g.102680 Transcript_36956/m.102680 type:complete len:98 (-) Transcript_36956:92-385(-)
MRCGFKPHALSLTRPWRWPQRIGTRNVSARKTLSARIGPWLSSKRCKTSRASIWLAVVDPQSGRQPFSRLLMVRRLHRRHLVTTEQFHLIQVDGRDA